MTAFSDLAQAIAWVFDLQKFGIKFGLSSTLDLLARTPNWLDPDVTLKVPRVHVYGLMAHSLATVWSTRALGRQARRLRERIRL